MKVPQDDDSTEFSRKRKLLKIALEKKFVRPFSCEVSTEYYNSIYNGDESNVLAAKEKSSFSEEESSHFLFVGAYGHLRKKLDYTYHTHYQKERQWLHDSIVEDFLDYQEDNNPVCHQGLGPQTEHDNISQWLIFSVGVQGAGKHYTFDQLIQKRRLCMRSYVNIAPDEIRNYLPEYSAYNEICPKRADDFTRKECGYIVETLLLASLEAGRDTIYHCQLTDTQWYKDYIQNFLKKQFPSLKIGLIHIIADDALVRKCRKRTQIDSTTWRKLFDDKLAQQLVQIPKAVAIVEPAVDFFCVIRNRDGDEPAIEGPKHDWTSFHKTFYQDSTVPVVSDDDAGNDANYEPSCRTGFDSPVLNEPSHSSRKSYSRKSFNAKLSTEQNYRLPDLRFYGQFAHIRELLDYSYHSNYTRERQRFQDAIICEFLSAAVIHDKHGEICTTPTEPWIVFTAGAMGAGKSYTMKKLVRDGCFPLLAFVQVDPDAIRRFLPEFPLYVKEDPESAGVLTGKEAGLIAEILTLAGLHAGKNVLVDGSLRHSEWYQEYFAKLRAQFSNLRIAIIHVTAPTEAIIQRAEERATQTGRVVPHDVLLQSIEQVPKSVSRLAHLTDYHVEVCNRPDANDVELITPGETWESFSQQWVQ